MVIAVDFDGTIVEDDYPNIGEPKIFAFETLKEIQKAHHQLILWTNREGEELKAAVEYCQKNRIEFYAVNSSYPEEKYDGSASRKINCEVFISHKNVGGMMGWGELWQEIKIISGEDKLYEKEKALKEGFMDKVAKFLTRR